MNHSDYSMDDWSRLLEPYGYVDITTHAPPCLLGCPHLVSVRFEITLKEDPAKSILDEWTRKLALMKTAQSAVEAVQEKGFTLEDPPRIEFGGNYYHVLGRKATSWSAEAKLSFEIYT